MSFAVKFNVTLLCISKLYLGLLHEVPQNHCGSPQGAEKSSGRVTFFLVKDIAEFQ